jgi:two-component system, cell cycle response regulator
MRVLIADDDRVMVQWLSGVLSGAGHRVTTAQDAQQAVMLALRTTPDLAILDIGMPAGSGEFALQRLKASSKTNTIPILVLTALKDPALPQRVRDLGAADVLFKPVPPDVLCQAVERLGQGKAG